MNTTAAPGAVKKNELEESRFVYHATLPTLQEIAAYQLAIETWYNYIASFEHINFNSKKKTDMRVQRGDMLNAAFGLEFKYYHDTCFWVDDEIPDRIRNIIVECLNKLIVETRQWVERFRFEIMRSDNLNQYLIRKFDPNWCVWFPNGDLDFKNTALKMLSVRGLTRVQKFAIMCEYCLEDKIKAFSLRLLPKKFIELVNFDEDPLLYYWICYLKEELHKIPLNNYSSTDYRMAVKCCCERWYAFEYFWNRLSPRHQILIAKSRLLNTSLSQERLLSEMSWDQQLFLLCLIPDKIITNFWLRLDSPQSALWAWRHCKHLLTNLQFAELVTKIFKSKYSDEEDLRLLIELWDSTPDHLKKYVAETQENEILQTISYMYDRSSNGMKFFHRFLSLKSPDFRKQMIYKNAVKFATRFEDPKVLSEVIDLCLPTASDRFEYKKVIMDSEEMRRHYEQLLNKDDFITLNQKLEFYSLDINAAREYKKQLLKSDSFKKSDFITDFEKWTKLCKCIDETFSDDPTSALNMKKQFVLSYAASFPKYFQGTPGYNKNASVWVNNSVSTSGLTETIKVVESLFQNEELEAIKRSFAAPLHKIPANEEYWWFLYCEKFHNFVQWCLSNDENALLELKRAVPVDAIFDDFFDIVNANYSGCSVFEECDFSGIDNVLIWLLSGVEKAKKYKLDRIKSPDDLKIFKSIAEQNDEPQLEFLLKWFYDGDQRSIRKFKNKKLRSK